MAPKPRTALIAISNAKGVVATCTSKCYELGKNPDTCACLGQNSGVGIQTAANNILRAGDRTRINWEKAHPEHGPCRIRFHRDLILLARQQLLFHENEEEHLEQLITPADDPPSASSPKNADTKRPRYQPNHEAPPLNEA
jgi:hypothetical protein